MQSNVDWASIKTKFEQGISQRTLAREYGVSQAAISQKAKKEKWVIIPLIIPIEPIITDNLDLDKHKILAIVYKLLEKAATHAQNELDVKDIKLLADALSQFHKIELTSPTDKPTASGIASELLPYLDGEQLAELASLNARQEEILETAKARKLEAEQGIMSIRKKAIG